MTNTSQIKVWDSLVRFFHWSLVTAFAIAYISEDDLPVIHNSAGYLILALLVIRFAWGFIGPRYARFTDFVYSPANIIQFLKDTMHFRARRYLGHNPAGGAMIILLMFSLLMICITGVLLLGADDHTGPAAWLFIQSADTWSGMLEEVHEFFANFTLLLVIIHVLGVVVESLIHKENLVSAMITGFKSEKIETEGES